MSILKGAPRRTYVATERLGEGAQGVLDVRSGAGEARLLRAALVEQLRLFADYATLPAFDFTDINPTPLFYVIAFQEGDSYAVFGRSITARQVPKHGGLLATFFSEGILQALEPELLLFDGKVDWIFHDDTFYVASSPSFERVFVDRAQLQQRVTAHVAELTKTLEIVGVDDFTRRVAGNLNMSVKLQRIIERGDYKTFPIPKLKAYAKRFRATIKWNQDAIVFDPAPSGQWDILTLLDEAWYQGELSSRRYEATSKLTV